jgi:hypothetical protein
MTGAASETVAQCRRALESALATPGGVSDDTLRSLAVAPPSALDEALRAFAHQHGEAALALLGVLASDRADRRLRRAAKRALYRLSQRGVRLPATHTARPVVTRQPERAVRAWLSGIDGSGSRAVWILFEGGYGGLSLCSLILNDTVGIVEMAGGDISKKRLETELRALRAEQKLPWVETDPERAVALVAEALQLHAAAGTSPPAEFGRWRRAVGETEPAGPPPLPRDVDPALLERSAELLELPEAAGWFLDPETVQADAVDVLQTRESRLVVTDQIKAEREDAILTRVLERELTPDARRRWARRLGEMALVFRAIERSEHARLAEAAATALVDLDRDVVRHPFARTLARRALEVAGEVALGRVSAADVSRKPGPVTAAG